MKEMEVSTTMETESETINQSSKMEHDGGTTQNGLSKATSSKLLLWIFYQGIIEILMIMDFLI